MRVNTLEMPDERPTGDISPQFARVRQLDYVLQRWAGTI